jgi:septum formation topological specificity factor MinE
MLRHRELVHAFAPPLPPSYDNLNLPLTIGDQCINEPSPARNEPELLGILRGEIQAVIGKHVALDPDKVQIKMDRGKTVSTLEVDIEIPNRLGALAGAA